MQDYYTRNFYFSVHSNQNLFSELLFGVSSPETVEFSFNKFSCNPRHNVWTAIS